MDKILQMNEFFVEGGRQDLSHVLLHITEPSTPEEISKGYFFAICEIDKAETKHISKLQEIIDRAENEYYETADTADKTALEIVLEKINQEAFSLTKSDISLNCVIGAIRQPEIIFAFYGHPQMILFYKNRQGHYQTMDLINANAAEGTAEPNQLFSQIVQGKISSSDYLFAGTSHIIDYFTQDRLEKIVTSKPAEQSARHLEKVLGEIKSGFSFGGLIIHVREQNDLEQRARKYAGAHGDSAKSLHGLFNTEKNTANTLSPSFLPRLNDAVKSIFRTKNSEANDQPEPPAREDRPAPPAQINSAHVYAHRQKTEPSPRLNFEKISMAMKTLLIYLKFVGQGLWWLVFIFLSLIKNLLRGVVMLFFVTINYQNRRKTILDDWQRQWRSYRENLRQLPAITKILLVALIIFGLVFAISLVYLRYEQRKSAAEYLWQDSIKRLKEKTDSAESSLIYKNDTAAISDLAEARNIFSGLSCNGKERLNTCSTLRKQLDDLTARVRRVTVVTPDLVVDWSTAFPGFHPQNIIKINSKLIAYSPVTSTLLVYDLLTKETKIITTLPNINGFTGASVPKENDYALFFYNNQSILKFNPADNSVSTADITYPAPNASVQTGVVYNRRLYTLDSLNNKIYKHDAIKTGFGRGTEWSRDAGESLRGGVNLTIDGDLYVLKNNGQISKLTKGVSQPFITQSLDPTLTTGGNIWTYTDVDQIYVLDSANKRLVILEKDGRLKKQITAVEFKNPTGLTVEVASGAAYILDGGKLYRIGIK